MAKYVKANNPTIEALTFDELVEFGKDFPGVNINNGMPWSFEYNKLPVTHENDNQYLITFCHGIIDFNKGDMLVTGEDNKTYIVPKDTFLATHEKLND